MLRSCSWRRTLQSPILFASCGEIFGARPSPAAAPSARFDAQDCFHTCSYPTFLRPRTGALLRFVAASPRCGVRHSAPGGKRNTGERFGGGVKTRPNAARAPIVV